QVGGTDRDLADGGQAVEAEDLGAVPVGGEHPPLVATGEDDVEAHEAELAGVGRGARDDDAAGLEQGPELLLGGSHQPATPAISTRASTAIGRPSWTIRGFRSAETNSGCASAAADCPTSTSTTASRSTAGSPRKGPSRAWVRSCSTISS